MTGVQTCALPIWAHRSITAAIRAQDSDAAVRRMERHVYAYAKAVIEVEERTEISIPDTD